MNTYDEDADDELARICESEHDMGPLDYCRHCQVRKEVVKCGLCDATYEGGKWWASQYTGDCDHMDDGVFDLFDDWGRRPVCPIIEVETCRQCGDPIITPGATACAFHQKWLDADECDRTYQRLVAVK